jgi:hypothetical protein
MMPDNKRTRSDTRSSRAKPRTPAGPDARTADERREHQREAGREGPDEEALERERYELLQRLEDRLETPMLVLAFAWLALLVVKLIWG